MSIKSLFADMRDYISLRPEEAVRDFVADFDWFLNERNLRPETVLGGDNLQAAVEKAVGAERNLATSLLAHYDRLNWRNDFSANLFGTEVASATGQVEILGPRGHFDASSMAIGFIVLGPNQILKGHKYSSEQLYIPLVEGTRWMLDFGSFDEKATGSPILVESNEIHAMQTGDTPLLALHLRRDGDLTQPPTV